MCEHEWEYRYWWDKVPFLFFFKRDRKNEYYYCKLCDSYLIERGTEERNIAFITEQQRLRRKDDNCKNILR
jgi:hypothetical protein